MKYDKYRLTKQRRAYDCGPTALVNVMKLCGFSVSYDAAAKNLFKALNVVENRGVYIDEFESYITRQKILKAKFKEKKRNLTYAQVEKNLDKGLIAVLAYGRGRFKSGHVCVVAGYDRCGLEIINWTRKKTIQIIGFDRFKREVLDFKDATYYFFERK